MAVALLADLGQLKQDIAAAEQCADRQASQVDALDHEILPERAGLYARTFFIERRDFLCGQQADLPVPAAGMRVPADAPVFVKLGLFTALLLHAAHRAGADGDNLPHGLILQFGSCSCVP